MEIRFNQLKILKHIYYFRIQIAVVAHAFPKNYVLLDVGTGNSWQSLVYVSHA